jgi:hypothetical protein
MTKNVMQMDRDVSFVGIDASLSSTAVCIRRDGSETYLNFTKNSTSGKWYKMLPNVLYTNVTYVEREDYSEGEICKAMEYHRVASMITSEISRLIEGSIVHVCMEGYSYSSAAGPLIDLVTFGTHLRHGLIQMLEDPKHKGKLTIVAPMSLKTFACASTYGYLLTEKQKSKKKVTYRNDEGVAGGSFKKREMLKSLFDLGEGCYISEELKYHQDELFAMKNIPKPVDDLVDSFWLERYAESNI